MRQGGREDASRQRAGNSGLVRSPQDQRDTGGANSPVQTVKENARASAARPTSTLPYTSDSEAPPSTAWNDVLPIKKTAKDYFINKLIFKRNHFKLMSLILSMSYFH